MKLFNIFKKQKEELKKVPLTDEQKISKTLAIERHKKRVINLNEEFEQLSNRLETLDLDTNLTKVEREKSSDSIIRRMSFIRYEVEIREGLIKWLS